MDDVGIEREPEQLMAVGMLFNVFSYQKLMLVLKAVRTEGPFKASEPKEFQRVAELALANEAQVLRYLEAKCFGFAPKLKSAKRDSLTMTRLPGRPLDKVFAGMNAASRTVVAHQVLALYAALHAIGVVHVDLKAANILYDHLTRQVFLHDFDNSMIGAPTPEHAALLRRYRFGSPGVMTPEIHENRPELLSPASDVHALGSFLYVALTGAAAPFRGDPATYRKVARAPFDAVPKEALRMLLPRQVEVLRAAWSVDPKDRPRDAGALMRMWTAGSVTAIVRCLESGSAIAPVALVKPVSIGRDAKNDLVVPAQYDRVSKRHVVIEPSGDAYAVWNVGRNLVHIGKGNAWRVVQQGSTMRLGEQLRIGESGPTFLVDRP